MVRKIEQRRVRGALDRFGPPLQSGGMVLNGAGDAPSAHQQGTLKVQRSYIKIRSRSR
jgi:hypothetical protein